MLFGVSQVPSIKMILKEIIFISYADDNTISAAKESIDHSILSFQESSKNS